MDDKAYFSALYEIARHLNREFSLHSALKKSLEKTVQLLHLETGWIWLVQDNVKSVYLAASYNLPPALSNHPERLSGWCYCIKKYLSNEMPQASNISEITCTRFKEIKSGTKDLKFHASVPINVNEEKVGLLNLLSKESQQLDEKQLAILSTISELIAITIQRTRTQAKAKTHTEDSVTDILQRVIQPKLKALDQNLQQARTFAEKKAFSHTVQSIQASIDTLDNLTRQFSLISAEASDLQISQNKEPSFHYPSSPLTPRELEVLALTKKGCTNRQIAEQLFITERTVKFHMSSILSKLFANTRTEAVEIAMQRGLIGL